MGTPSLDPPDFFTPGPLGASDVGPVAVGLHQYARPAGHMPLVEQLARTYSKQLTGAENNLCPLTQILVTAGACQLKLDADHYVGGETHTSR